MSTLLFARRGSRARSRVRSLLDGFLGYQRLVAISVLWYTYTRPSWTFLWIEDLLMPCFLAKKRTETPIFFNAKLRNGWMFGSLLLIPLDPQHFYQCAGHFYCPLASIFMGIRHTNNLVTTKGFGVSKNSVSLKYCFFAQFCSLVLWLTLVNESITENEKSHQLDIWHAWTNIFEQATRKIS